MAVLFRKAIEKLRDEGVFNDDFSFHHFPCGCCGDASDLLGQFLLDQGIETWYVCGTYIENFVDVCGESNLQSHAWLTTDNPDTREDFFIIDITGDQFNKNLEYNCRNEPVYVGRMDSFHKLFETESGDMHPSAPLYTLGMAAPRLIEKYNQIIKELENVYVDYQTQGHSLDL